MGPTPRVPLCPSLLLVEADGRVVVSCHGQHRLPRRSGLDNVIGTLEGQPRVGHGEVGLNRGRVKKRGNFPMVWTPPPLY